MLRKTFEIHNQPAKRIQNFLSFPNSCPLTRRWLIFFIYHSVLHKTLPRLRILRRADRSRRHWQVIPASNTVPPSHTTAGRQVKQTLTGYSQLKRCQVSFQPNTIRLYILCPMHCFQQFNNYLTCILPTAYFPCCCNCYCHFSSNQHTKSSILTIYYSLPKLRNSTLTIRYSLFSKGVLRIYFIF